MKRLALLAVLLASPGYAKLNVITTTPDLDALVKSVGGDQVESSSIAKGSQDVHHIEAKPSFMVKMRGADLVVAQGLELEDAWLTPLIQGARNSKLAAGQSGFLELGSQLTPIEVRGGNVSRAEGDVHPQGNPHFQLDPVRMGQGAVLIAERLGQLDPAHKDEFAAKAKTLQTRLDDKTKEWAARIKKTGITEVVTYHKTFSYFFDRFGLKNDLQLEPRPGIPPTAAHLMDVFAQMKKKNLKLVWIENYYEDTVKNKIAKEVPSAKVVTVPVAVGGEPAVTDNEKLFERLVKSVEDAAQ